MEITKVDCLVSDDFKKMDFAMIHLYLSQTYWSEGISKIRMKRAMENSLNVGAFVSGQQVGYARIVTDQATYAYLCDVFVLDFAKGKGYSKLMLEFILKMHELSGIKRFSLATKDAHKLYAQFGWKPLENPAMYMEIYRPGIYKLLDEL